MRYVGDPVAAVAATSREAAAEAAALVEIEIDELPYVLDPEAALQPGAPVIWSDRPDNVAWAYDLARGDVDAAFDRADRVFAGEYSTNRIYHAYLEPIGVIAEYEAPGSYVLHVPTQIPYLARRLYARALGVDEDHVRVIVPPIGGGFGAKYEMFPPLIAAVLARATHRPIRILFDREEDAASATPRVPFVFRHRIAVAEDGRFLGREAEVIAAGGGRTGWSPSVLMTAVSRIDSLYDFHAMRGRGRLVYTNENPTTCMRGFGQAQTLFGIEQLVDDIARELRIDPIDLRLRNTWREGDTTLHGWVIGSSKLPQCLTRIRELAALDGRQTEAAQPDGGRVRRGIGISIGNHVSGYRTIMKEYDGSSAILRCGMDGSVGLYVGEPDIGQGASTALAQIVADSLGCGPADVTVHRVDSAFSPDAVGTLASRVTTLVGMAAQSAALAARSRLLDFVAGQWSCDAGELEIERGRVRSRATPEREITLEEALRAYGVDRCGLPLIGEGVYRPPTQLPDQTGYGNPSAAYPFAAHAAEVEVDCETGQARVLRYWAVHDSGRIINPSTARGQVLGAIAQGIGWALMEDVVLRQGRVQNPNYLDYRVPGAADMPDVTVEFVAGGDPNGPFGAKSLAEVALDPVTAAVANAIRDATGVRCTALPMSSERLWEALHSAGEGA